MSGIEITITLDEPEVSMLRAGLAAHAQLMNDLRTTTTSPETRDLATNQRARCRDLSLRLGSAVAEAVAQVALSGTESAR